LDRICNYRHGRRGGGHDSAAQNVLMMPGRPGNDGGGDRIPYLGNDVFQMPSLATGRDPRKRDQTHEDANNDKHADCSD
jgi:hypothetical protein